MKKWFKRAAVCGGAVLLVACGSAPRKPAPTAPATPSGEAPPAQLSGTPSPYHCAYTAGAQGSGGFYLDDGPHDTLPPWIDLVPEPVPRWEPLNRFANNPYTVLGQSFTPLKSPGSLKQQGTASWYGRKFHGQKTSSGEVYDMYTMTAASPILPIPSYARVTNTKNGRSVIVRVNDRGPFKKGRVMDLSFLAACRLGYAMNGSTDVVVESLAPGQPIPTDTPQLATAPAAVVTTPLADAGATTTSQPLPAAPVVAEKPEPVPVTVSAAGVYLQLGAFSSLGNAENFRDHWARDLEGDAAKLGIQSSGNIHRVRLGPYPDRQAALAAAERLTGDHNLQAVISR
ncbi:septal ring lytic transglycosylase RlpA family protein [Silvimonas sp.]|uniref:septal ring lytic transglycosylase RlpA family protein n=1 Tax=Silvimonas sp. TaxID=2650811 RepID=UPI002845FC8F|nr:septal ring lytic transglycosylase RlpA family protein [Silvimonas sp.]MDR3427284.1 septal ring lytic transglycosylase RlpA family protein [Silvimonas sp.]